ncbi:glucosamine inositolphosphorylceramide transferase family protein [Rhodopseudomonas sp.]|uniref:glucosamine inositolphosphorylceramide transferase family protein n=1 Tax=Rhodopseudomonas sp. TaxID=1078 RepID=UPI003B3BCB39
MHICLQLDRSRLFRWHIWLAEALLAVPGQTVSRQFAASSHPIPRGVSLLLDLERSIYRLAPKGAMDPASSAALSLAPERDDTPDVVVDLAGDGVTTAAQRVLRPTFNGISGEIGVMAALSEGADLLIELHDTARPGRPWTARPASQDREVFGATLDAALSCTVALILKAMSGERGVTSQTAAAPGPVYTDFGTARSLAWASASVAAKAIRLLGILAKGAKEWRIAWRLDRSGTGLLDCGKASFRVLTGGVGSYLADPFPFRHGGRDFIFVEQYLHAKNKGCIAVVPMNGSGVAGPAEIVLEEAHHLSYPVVFEQAGQIWMIPEAGESGKVTLYRAESFPYRWKREADLANGIEAYDVTPLADDSGVWFFAAQRLWRSSSWDVLNIYRADSLTGSWKPHGVGSALIDAALSRPAGSFIRRDGQTLRPVQDCSRGYGSGLTFCRIDALDAFNFAQTAVGRVGAGPYGCHTYNRRDGIEVVDLFGRIADAEDVTISYVPLPTDSPAARSSTNLISPTFSGDRAGAGHSAEFLNSASARLP